MVKCYGMAKMNVRATFALDAATEESIRRLAELWKTSKAEVVRRSVAEADRAAAAESRPSPLEALEWLQANGTFTEDEAAAWSAQSKRGWDEAWKRKEKSAETAGS